MKSVRREISLLSKVGVLKFLRPSRTVSLDRDFFAINELLRFLSMIDGTAPQFVATKLRAAPSAGVLEIFFGAKIRTRLLVAMSQEKGAIGIADISLLIDATYQQIRSALRRLERDLLVVQERLNNESSFRLTDDYDCFLEFKQLLSTFVPFLEINPRVVESSTIRLNEFRSTEPIPNLIRDEQFSLLTVLQSAVLRELRFGPNSASAIAEKIGLRRNAILEIFASLRTKGIVDSHVAKVGNRMRLVAKVADPEYWNSLIDRCDAADIRERLAAREQFRQKLLSLKKDKTRRR